MSNILVLEQIELAQLAQSLDDGRLAMAPSPIR